MVPLAPVSKGHAGRIMVTELMRLNGYTTAKAKGIAQSVAVTRGVVKSEALPRMGSWDVCL
jgi:hypothetical protein